MRTLLRGPRWCVWLRNAEVAGELWEMFLLGAANEGMNAAKLIDDRQGYVLLLGQALRSIRLLLQINENVKQEGRGYLELKGELTGELNSQPHPIPIVNLITLPKLGDRWDPVTQTVVPGPLSVTVTSEGEEEPEQD